MRTRTMTQRLRSIPPVVEKHFPPQGVCLLCGFGDKRHRMFDAIADRIRAGESERSVIVDYRLPRSTVRAIVAWWH